MDTVREEGVGGGCSCSISLERSKMRCVGADLHIHIYIYIVLVYVCARSAPTAYACDYKTLSSFTQHSRLATRVPIHSMRMLCYSYFIMRSQPSFLFKTFNLKHLIIEFSFSILCCICWDGDGTYICCSCACVCHFFRCVVAAFTHSQN